MRFDPYSTPYTQGQRPSPGKNIIDFLRRSHLLNRVVLFLVIMYGLYLLTWLYMYLFAVPLRFNETDFRFFVKYIALPTSPELLSEQPWALFTHFVVHTSFLSLIFHILILSLFGRLFFDFWRGGRFIFLLLASSFAGAACFLYASAVFPSLAETADTMLTGAGAAAFGLMMYMFVFMPEHVFQYMMVVRLKMKHLVLIIIAIDLLTFSASAPGVHLSHLGGALFGAGFALIVKLLKNKVSFRSGKKFRQSKPKRKIYEQQVRTKTDEEYNFLKKQKQERLDAILEKISRSGYGSLSEEEKRFLFYESKR